jgi:hypothetical protein
VVCRTSALDLVAGGENPDLGGLPPTPPIEATVYTQVWIKAKTLEIPLNPPWKGGLRPDLSPLFKGVWGIQI